MTKRTRPEDALQRTIFKHLRTRGARDMVAFHVPNGGLRNRIEAAILKGLGVEPGIPDVFVLQPGPPGFCKVTTLELKSPSGRLSPEQCNMLATLCTIGANAHVSSNLDHAISVLEECGALRGKASLRTLSDVAARVGRRKTK
jgi:VRR-NUC domain